MTGLGAFLRFEVLRLVRNPRYVAITLGFPVVFYALFLHSLQPARRVDGTAWNTYFMVSMACFGAVVAALNAGGTRLAAERASGWTRQLSVTPLPAWSYVTTKIAASMVIALPVIFLVEMTGLTVGGVRLGLGTWFVLTAVLWASTLPFVVLGVLVGFVASSETAYPLVTALMFFLSFFGGLFTPVANMPTMLRHVAAFLPSYHGAALGWSVVAGRAPELRDVGVLVVYALVLGLAVTWRQRAEEARAFA
ncbi:MAG: ABC transporter permease [Acidimicrobiales bacterium]|jgi:ABC-2 type transport system permease protein